MSSNSKNTSIGCGVIILILILIFPFIYGYDHPGTGLAIFGISLIVLVVGWYFFRNNEKMTKTINLILLGLSIYCLVGFVFSVNGFFGSNQEKGSSTVTVTQDGSSKVNTEPKEITFQEYFIQQKAGLYNSGYINAANDAAKMLFHKNTEKLTKQLLDSTDKTLTNWVGTISRVSLAYGRNQRDMELLKTMSPNDVIEKYPEGRDINIVVNVGEKKLDQATYLTQVYQEFNPKKNERGIKPNSPLYETILGLKEGEEVVFSAKVNRTMDTKGKNNEQYTGINIELTDLKSAN